jgi:hypothetical protein
MSTGANTSRDLEVFWGEENLWRVWRFRRLPFPIFFPEI